MLKKNHYVAIITCMLVGIIGRIIPHPANITPMNSLCLFSGSRLPKWVAVLIIATTLVISDALLAMIYGYPVFSFWSLLTYSGWLGIIFLGSKMDRKSRKSKVFLFVLGSSFGFWLWTNFGVWLTTAAYPKNIDGLIACYFSAIPFLRKSLLGDVVWFMVIFCAFDLAVKIFCFFKREWRNWQTRWI